MEKKTYSVSEQTKHALADALKKLMAQKALEKITIHELTELCGMKRQNFYYHFEDIYDLLRWMFEEEAVSILKDGEGTLLWQDGILKLLYYLQENRAVCLCALKSVGRDHIKRFFETEIHAIIFRTIEQIEELIGNENSENTDVELLTHFYIISLAGLVESWLLGELDKTPEELVSFANTFIEDYIAGVKCRKNNQKTG